MKLLLFILFINISLLFSENINLLLESLTKSDDLSNYTKKENEGFLIVYKREELEKMHLSNLKEIVDKIPILHYNENNYALSDPYYNFYQNNNPLFIRVYINDIEIHLPFGQSALSLISNMNTNYIDHIEIYLGVPSFRVSPLSSLIVLKIYTKKGFRENSNNLGFIVNNRFSNAEYFTSGYGDEDKSYFMFLSNDIYKHKNYKYNNYHLNRNNYSKTFILNASYKKITFFNIINSIRHNNFIAKGFKIAPLSPYFKISGFLTNIKYSLSNKSSFSLFYAFNKGFLFEHNDYIAGIDPITHKPYKQEEFDFNSKILRLSYNSSFHYNRNEIFFLFQLSKENFNRYNLKYDGIEGVDHITFSKKNIINISLEDEYLFDNRKLFNFSYSYRKQMNNGNARNYIDNLLRIGYIYNKNFIYKFFISRGSFAPIPFMIFRNPNLRSTSVSNISFKIIKKLIDSQYSFLMSYQISKYWIINSTKKIINYNHKIFFYPLIFSYEKNFDHNNKLIFDLSRTYQRSKDFSNINDKINFTLFNRVLNFDIYNYLSYIHDFKNSDGIIYNFSISRNYKNFEIFFKGLNLLNKNLNSKYIVYDPITNTYNLKNDIDVIERSFLVGLEWKF